MSLAKGQEKYHIESKKKGPEQSKNCQLNNEEAGRGRGLLTQAQTLDIFGLKVAVDSQTAWQTEVPTEGRRDNVLQTGRSRAIHLGRILIDLLRAAGPPRCRLPHNECHTAPAGGERPAVFADVPSILQLLNGACHISRETR